MTLSDVMKQNGVGSVKTLYRECMGRVAFCCEGHSEIKIKLPVDVINNKIIIMNTFEHQVMGRGGGLWPVSKRQIE